MDNLRKILPGLGPISRKISGFLLQMFLREVFSYLSLEEIKSCGVNALRIDNGIPEETIAELSKTFGIILNASTIDDAFIENLYRCGYQGEIEAWQ